MKKTRRPRLTARQRTLLTSARDTIRNQPWSYDQTTYGTGRVACATPGCIAGHIVSSDDDLRKQLAAILAVDDSDERSLKEQTWEAIERVAVGALDTESNPELFRSGWPTEWRRTLKMPYSSPWVDQSETFIPTGEEAVQVLDGVLDGRIRDALEPSLYDPQPE